MADPAHVTEAVGAAVEQHGALDIVVNNAGIGGPGWHEVLEVNLGGARLVCETALPHLVERRGSIVNVSSVSAFHAYTGGAAYTVSKAGLVMLTKQLALEYGPRGVRANAVCPGWVRTEMGDRAMDYMGQERGVSREEAYELTARYVPLRRVAARRRSPQLASSPRTRRRT